MSSSPHTFLLDLPVFPGKKIGRPWIAECLHVWTPDAKPNTTSRFLSTLRSAPGRFRLPIGSVCYIHKPFLDTDDEVCYTRYFVLVHATHLERLTRVEANQIIDSRETYVVRNDDDQ